MHAREDLLCFELPLIFSLCCLSTAWSSIILRPHTHRLPSPILAGSASEQTRYQATWLQRTAQVPYPAPCQAGDPSTARWVCLHSTNNQLSVCLRCMNLLHSFSNLKESDFNVLFMQYKICFNFFDTVGDWLAATCARLDEKHHYK